MKIAGVDPGLSGGLAVLDTESNWFSAMKMPILTHGKTKLVNGAAIGDWLEETQPDIVNLEHVTSWGRADAASPVSVAKMSAAFGVALGAVAAMLIPHELATPVQWKTPLGLKGKEKIASHALACRLFPMATKLLTGPRGGALVDLADALMLCVYQARKMRV